MNVVYKHVILTCAHTVRYAHTWSGMLPAHCGTCAGAGNRNIFFSHAHVSRQPGSRTPRLYSTHHTEAGALKHTWTQSQVHSSTHEHRARCTQAHTSYRPAHSSTHEHRGRRTQAHTHTHTPTDTCTCTYHRQNRYWHQVGECADTGTHSPYACTLKHIDTHVHKTVVLYLLSSMNWGCVCWGTCTLLDRNLPHGGHMWDGGKEIMSWEWLSVDCLCSWNWIHLNLLLTKQCTGVTHT